MVCSDGLWNYASSPAAIGTLVAPVADGVADPASDDDPLGVAERLVAWANEQGGHDNITAALARYDPSLR